MERPGREMLTASAGTTSDILEEIFDERVRQDAKWGEQNHPNGTGGPILEYLARKAREHTDQHVVDKTVTWYDILTEEYAEAMAETDPVKLRAELVQTAAVAASWVEAIDRRAA